MNGSLSYTVASLLYVVLFLISDPIMVVALIWKQTPCLLNCTNVFNCMWARSVQTLKTLNEGEKSRTRRSRPKREIANDLAHVEGSLLARSVNDAKELIHISFYLYCDCFHVYHSCLHILCLFSSLIMCSGKYNYKQWRWRRSWGEKNYNSRYNSLLIYYTSGRIDPFQKEYYAAYLSLRVGKK